MCEMRVQRDNDEGKEAVLLSSACMRATIACNRRSLVGNATSCQHHQASMRILAWMPDALQGPGRAGRRKADEATTSAAQQALAAALGTAAKGPGPLGGNPPSPAARTHVRPNHQSSEATNLSRAGPAYLTAVDI